MSARDSIWPTHQWIHLSRILLSWLGQDLVNFKCQIIFSDLTQHINPPINPSINPPMGGGVSTNHKLSNSIDLSQLCKDLFHFLWFNMIPPINQPIHQPSDQTIHPPIGQGHQFYQRTVNCSNNCNAPLDGLMCPLQIINWDWIHIIDHFWCKFTLYPPSILCHKLHYWPYVRNLSKKRKGCIWVTYFLHLSPTTTEIRQLFDIWGIITKQYSK